MSTAELNAAIVLFYSMLDEKQRRLYTGLESLKLGHGGDRLLADLLGVDPHTVARGRRELMTGQFDAERHDGKPEHLLAGIGPRMTLPDAGECELADVILPTEITTLFVAPSTTDLVGAEIELISADREVISFPIYEKMIVADSGHLTKSQVTPQS